MKSLLFTLTLTSVGLSSCGPGSIKRPEYRDIQNVRLIEAGLLQSVAGLDIIYYNPNKFGMQLNDANGDVYIENNYLGRFGMQDKIAVGKRSEFIVPAILKLDMMSIMNHHDIFNKKEVLVKIEGIARVKKSGIAVNVPIKYEGMQNTNQLRAIVLK